MNNVFAIRKDIPKYKVLDLDILDITRELPDNIDLDSVYNFSQLNTSMASWWVTTDTKYVSTNNRGDAKDPDISCWIDATLTLSPRAYRLLKDLLSEYGEFLPVSISGELHYIFNCFSEGEPIKEACVFNNEEGMQAGLKYLEFDKSVSNLVVFKTKIESCLTLFCNNRFKEIVESFGLNGVIFDENLVTA
ncbi:MAG: hypothetical protein EOO43_06875 [Flavobacterium sp.]|nr:MAG: hypothetical protein EOO43_06875 [Flavobacterium sp.]